VDAETKRLHFSGIARQHDIVMMLSFVHGGNDVTKFVFRCGCTQQRVFSVNEQSQLEVIFIIINDISTRAPTADLSSLQVHPKRAA